MIAGTNPAHATVGGPTLVHDFTYNPADESVYYQKLSADGRGCPPELMRLSLADGAIDKALSCDEGEALRETSGTNSDSAVATKLYEMTKAFKRLTPINLPKNHISVDIRFVNYENIGPEIDEIQKANFVATVQQSGKALGTFPIVGCSEEQPFSFAGYAIPGFEKKIILLLSAKGDCWEGGYIRESLHVLGGVSGLDKTSVGTFYKGLSALVPNEGTLVVFAHNRASASSTQFILSPDTNTNTLSVTLLVATLLVGLGGGVALGKLRKE